MATKKPAARITKSLDTLRSQANKLAPKRSKASDGWLGDAKHSMRKSDHNPEPDGTVDAFDLTHDPANGVDIQKVCDAIIASRDPRVSYLICNGKIIAGNNGPKPWVKRPYTGPNKHTKHLHVSVLDKMQDDTTPWAIESAFGKPAAPKPVPRPTPRPVVVEPAEVITTEEVGAAVGDTPIVLGEVTVKDLYDGKVHPEVKAVQTRLDALGYPEVGELDGKWGTRTRAAILAFRADNALPLLPTIDDALMAALMMATPRYVNPARANATVADLRKEDVEEVKEADKTQAIGGGVAGLGGIVGVGAVLDFFKGYAEPLKDAAAYVEPVTNFVKDNIWLIAVGAGLYFLYQSGYLKKLRLQKHQEGQDVSR